MNNICRTFLFIVFFSIGAATLSCSILFDDIVGYYYNKQLLDYKKCSLEQIKNLNAEYDVLQENLRQDPNLIKRIAAAALGTEPQDTNSIHPKVTAEKLDAARKALADKLRDSNSEFTLPKWLIRCNEPRYRYALFFAGAGLILLAFIFFTTSQKKLQIETD